ncbi:hypothetical protein [Melittangium boletus]|uniref:hypothetical protein n=1 Tax=Melittangium boletus TaxID=83453 RepID=UPI003DA623C7
MTAIRFLLSCLVCVAMLLPGVGRAEDMRTQEAPVSGWRQVTVEEPPALSLEPPTESPGRQRSVRLLAGLGLGLLAGAAGGATGYLVGDALCTPSSGGWFSGLECLAGAAGGATGYLVGDALCTPSSGGWFSGLECLGYIFNGAFLGVAVGYPLGAWGGGALLGGEGRLWATMFGSFAGFSTGLALMIVTKEFFLWPMALALGIVGTHLGYEWSRPSEPARASQARARLQPVLSFSQKGALVGMGGVF